MAGKGAQLLQHWLRLAGLLSCRSTPLVRPGAPAAFWGSFLGSFLAIAMKISFTFIAVLADVSMKSKLLSSA